MIVVEGTGRLGNQMFRYAFGVAATARLATGLAMSADDLRRLFALPPTVDPTGAPELPLVLVSNEDDPHEVLARLEDGRRYNGFFQSERYFADARERVRDSFTLLPEHVAAFRARYGDLLRRPYVCCHVRRTDYETFAGGVALPMSFYRDALARIRLPGSVVVFVGDDLREARVAFAEIPGTRFEQNDEAIDLQLLTNATAVVVSNSTFAWWGAWLNARPDKRVLAPQHWIGFKFGWEYPRGVLPGDWEQVPVPIPWRTRLSFGRLKTTGAGVLRRTRRVHRR